MVTTPQLPGYRWWVVSVPSLRVGRTYLLRGAPVRVLVGYGGKAPFQQWACSLCGRVRGADVARREAPLHACEAARMYWIATRCRTRGSVLRPLDRKLPRQGPRNVLVEPLWADGMLAGYPARPPFVRSFRGLRRQNGNA